MSFDNTKLSQVLPDISQSLLFTNAVQEEVKGSLFLEDFDEDLLFPTSAKLNSLDGESMLEDAFWSIQ